MMEFPKDFLWGAATSAYQVEGDNSLCDWWEWEKRLGLEEASGSACRHYDLYANDFDLAKELNHNAHRLSIEWSRIEPQEGKFQEKEIQHYCDVILALGERNIEPIVTLHHFTNPIWFAQRGGWLHKGAGAYFLRYTERVLQALAEKVRFWVTINEPLVYAYHSYVSGAWPPQEKSIHKGRAVGNNLIRAHLDAYKLIHRIYNAKGLQQPLVSLAHNMIVFFPCVPSLKNKIATFLRDRIFNFAVLDKLARHKALDFLGINYYTRHLVEVESWGFKHMVEDVCKKGHQPLPKNSLGWDIYPQGLHDLLVRLKKYKLPIYILENGICTEDDTARWQYIYEHLKNIYLALRQGVNVRGYIYWSLMDNFEWDKGFRPRFGLIEVDYRNFARRIRESARNLALVCKTGRLE